jgi:hypothetical protein
VVEAASVFRRTRASFPFLLLFLIHARRCRSALLLFDQHSNPPAALGGPPRTLPPQRPPRVAPHAVRSSRQRGQSPLHVARARAVRRRVGRQGSGAHVGGGGGGARGSGSRGRVFGQRSGQRPCEGV